MQRLADIRSEVRAKMQKGTDSTYNSRIDQWINSRYKDIHDRYLWRDLIVFNEAISVGAEEFLVLPKECDILLALTQRTTPAVIIGLNTQVYQSKYIDQATTTGTPRNWTPAGTVGVADQPSSASALSISSSDSDDITQIVNIRGVAGGQRVRESVTLTGTTAVSSSNTYTTVESISKSANTDGVVTVTSNSDAITICALAPEDTTGYYRRLRLQPIPDAAFTGYLCYKKRFYRMTNDNDVPQFECDRYLVHGAYVDSLKEMEKYEQAVFEERLLDKRLKDMISTRENQVGTLNHRANPRTALTSMTERIY